MEEGEEEDGGEGEGEEDGVGMAFGLSILLLGAMDGMVCGGCEGKVC